MFRVINVFFPKTSKKIFSTIYLIISIFFLSYFLFDFFVKPQAFLAIRNILYWITSVWMGVFVYLLLFYAAKDVVLFFAKLTKICKTPLPAKQTVLFCGLPFVLAIGVSVYGLINGANVKTVQHRIEAEQISDNFKIVLVSDIHLGAVQSEERLPEIIQKINAQNPDLVCISGDIFNDRYTSVKNPESARKLFRQINSKHGVYACLGNHDGGQELDLMLNFLKESGIKLLNEESTNITDEIILIGRTDGSPIGGFGNIKRQDTQYIMHNIPQNKFAIIMEHNPARINEYSDNADLILCGHTHKGQIFPANFVTNAMYDMDYGHQKFKDTNVVVTSGAGTWGMPMRVGSNCEIVAITLQ